MNHQDHVNLIKDGIGEGEVWADFGSGTGAFTLALRDVAGEEAHIYSIDKDEKSLTQQKEKFETDFPETIIEYIFRDFTEKLVLPPLDGIIAANSLHYIQDKKSIFRHLKSYLKPNGRLVVVEYNTKSGNIWVPFPFTFQTFSDIAKEVGFREVKQLGAIPSQFLDEIYSAVAML